MSHSYRRLDGQKREPKYLSATYNVVRDWNKLQGFTNSTDSHIQIVRDYHHRKVSVQNSGLRPVGLAITTYYSGPKPELQYVLKPGEDLALAINSYGEQMQFMHLLDPKTKEYVGHPSPFRSKSNMFVLRDGLNQWWVDTFHLAGISAAV